MRLRYLDASLVLVALWAAPFAFSQDHEVDVDELLNELQLSSQAQDRMTVVFWFPEELWRATADPALPESMAEQFLSVLRPYVMFGVVDGTMGPLGGVTFRDPKELRNLVVLVDEDGARYKPLAEDRISPDARNFVSMVKPLFANLLGQTGQGSELLFFPATASDGARIADAKREGTFSLEIGDQSFEWRTPLASLLPKKLCPVDRRQMSGAWTYCPWHGAILITQGEEGEP